MSSLGGSASASKPASYAPFQGVKPKAVENGSSYLSALTSSSTSSVSSAPSVSAMPGLSFMAGLGAGSSMKKASYAPFQGVKPKAVENGSSYLSALKNAPSTISSSIPASQASASISTPASSADYMSALGNRGTMKRASYSGFNSKPRAPIDDKSYLGALTHAAPVQSSYRSQDASPVPAASNPYPASSNTPKSYAPFGSKPKVVAQSGYLSGL